MVLDTEMVHSYLQLACAALGFDIGELWCCQNSPGDDQLKFVKLYTSQAYSAHRGRLVTPTSEGGHRGVGQHIFSPLICNAVRDGGKIVWANSVTDSGLLGRSDLPLRTAVGAPMCCVGSELCFIVLFSPFVVPSTQPALDFLCLLERVATEPASCMIPISSSHPVSPATSLLGTSTAGLGVRSRAIIEDCHNQCVNLQMWNVQELSIATTSTDTSHSAYQSHIPAAETSPVSRSAMGVGGGAYSDELHVPLGNFSTFEQPPYLAPLNMPLPNEQQPRNSLGPGVHAGLTGQANSGALSATPFGDDVTRSRFEHFLSGFLGSSLFQLADCWLPTGGSSCPLFQACSSILDPRLFKWKGFCGAVTLFPGLGLPGRVCKNGVPLWDEYSLVDPMHNPLAPIAALMGIHTAVGIPMNMGPMGTGVVIFYSLETLQSNDVLITFLQKATALLLDRNGILSPSPHHAASVDVDSPSMASFVPGNLFFHQPRDGQMESFSMQRQQHYMYQALQQQRSQHAQYQQSLQHQQHQHQSFIASKDRDISFSMGLAPVPAPAALNVAGKKVCKVNGCREPTVRTRPYCVRHGGSRQCSAAGCTKCAQGATSYCIAHGGGRRCTYPGCNKGARDRHFCAAHGGGKRCTVEKCMRAAVGGSNFCTAHGGGKRCQHPSCTRSAQSSTSFCVRHGGGKRCAVSGCEKVARGRTSFCAAHGGGIRCRLEGCNRVALGKMQLCRNHTREVTDSASSQQAAPSPAVAAESRLYYGSEEYEGDKSEYDEDKR